MRLIFAPIIEHEHPWFFVHFSILEKLRISIIFPNKLIKYEGKNLDSGPSVKTWLFFRLGKIFTIQFFCAHDSLLRDAVSEFLSPYSFKIDSCSVILKKSLNKLILLLISRCCWKGLNLPMGTPKSEFWKFFVQTNNISKFVQWVKNNFSTREMPR